MKSKPSSDSDSAPARAGSEVRVRFAPSPTGYLHIGGARTALYNYLFARRSGGRFIYRIEDTDRSRSTTESMRMQISDMQWLGLDWDEGPEPQGLGDRGELGPYMQSLRQANYQKAAGELIEGGKAYHCFCSDALLEAKKQKALSEGRAPHYDGECQALPGEVVRQRLSRGEVAAVRFVVDDRPYNFTDLVRGEIEFPAGMVGDFIILRSDGMPVYNFCCVVDDAQMQISHVLRAEEHLSNTLRQLMLYEGLGLKPPQFGHLSIILDTDRQKMSKRRGATSCHEFQLEGYLPEALLNFIALLGWSSPTGQEILSLEELVEQFSLERLHAAPAVFDEAKLRWVNATHLRALPNDELWRRVEPFLEGLVLPQSPSWRHQALEVFKTAMETLRDARELFRPLSSTEFVIDPSSRDFLAHPTTGLLLKSWIEKLSQVGQDFLSEADFVRLQNEIRDECGIKGKFLFMPLRVAVIGKPEGAELKILVPLIPCSVLMERARLCLEAI